jgi:Transposase DDE domain
MPYKFSESRRHKIPKARYRVTSWPEYDAALVRWGGIRVWFTDQAVVVWHAPATGTRSGQPIDSTIAIATGLTLPLVFHQLLRQTEGPFRSIADMLGIFLAIPDHTTLNRRTGDLTILPRHIDRTEPLHLLVDNTSPKIYGESESLDQKHSIRSHRGWHKLHRGMNADTHEIVAVELTPDGVGDVSEIPRLLDQTEADVDSITADGAYHGEAVHNAAAERHPDAAVVIPPRIRVVASRTTSPQRNLHITTIAKHGRMGWQRRPGYKRRSLIEIATCRYKTIVGRRLHARTLPNQRTEALIGCNILNRMAGLGMPTSVRVH